MNTQTPLPCPICHSERTRFLFEGGDLVFGYPDRAFVHQCRNCDHVFVAGELTPEILTDMYSNYYPRSNFHVDEYKPHQEKSGFFFWLDGEEGRAFRHVPKNVRVLDIGCGFCETLGYHKARGCDVYGVEADENARKIAERHGFHVDIGLLVWTQKLSRHLIFWPRRPQLPYLRTVAAVQLLCPGQYSIRKNTTRIILIM